MKHYFLLTLCLLLNFSSAQISTMPPHHASQDDDEDDCCGPDATKDEQCGGIICAGLSCFVMAGAIALILLTPYHPSKPSHAPIANSTQSPTPPPIPPFNNQTTTARTSHSRTLNAQPTSILRSQTLARRNQRLK